MEEEFGYPWTLERLRQLSWHYAVRVSDLRAVPLTPIEEILLTDTPMQRERGARRGARATARQTSARPEASCGST